MEELQQMRPGEESKTKMLDILKRFHENEEADSFNEEDSSLSEETIQKILSGCEISFADLSVAEKKHFQRAIASGELSRMIEPWDPWWLRPSTKYVTLSSDGTQLVQRVLREELGVSVENNIGQEQCHDIPPGPDSPLPPITKLTASPPSPLLTVHLVDIIYSYCFTLRLYDGDWNTDPSESVTMAMTVSSVLCQSQQPETVLEVLSHCLAQTCSQPYNYMGGFQFGLRVIDDVIHLLYLGGAALVCLLCDLQRLIQTAEKELKFDKLHKSKRVELRSKLKSADRKIYFVMCWVHQQPSEVCSSLAAIVTTELSAMEYADSKITAKSMEQKTERRGKPLIKEVSRPASAD